MSVLCWTGRRCRTRESEVGETHPQEKNGEAETARVPHVLVVTIPDSRLRLMLAPASIRKGSSGRYRSTFRFRFTGSTIRLPQEFIERFTTLKGGAPFTWGDAILNRIGARNSLYRNTYPFGSPFTG